MCQRFLRQRRQAERDEGAVTAEMAMALPVLVLLAWAPMWFVCVLGVQARCVEAARAAARAGARGDDPAAAARQLLPAGAKLRVDRRDGWLEVDVTGSRPPPGPLAGWLPPLPVSGRSVAAIEDQLDGQAVTHIGARV